MSDEKFLEPTVNALDKYLNFDKDELRTEINDRPIIIRRVIYKIIK